MLGLLSTGSAKVECAGALSCWKV